MPGGGGRNPDGWMQTFTADIQKDRALKIYAGEVTFTCPLSKCSGLHLPWQEQAAHLEGHSMEALLDACRDEKSGNPPSYSLFEVPGNGRISH
jgi:hypothetical protein